MDIPEEKEILRHKMKLNRRQFSETQKLASSILVFKKIEQLDIFKRAKIVLLFWSLEDEIYTHDFVIKWSISKKILLPVIHADELELKLFTDKGSLKKSSAMNLLEPVGKTFTGFDKIDMAIIPGLAFDKNNNRLGYGKGYYDKLLSRVHVYKIGICFNFQLLDSLPVTKKDVKMDMVVTDKKL